jgi:hypothetical protein
MKSERTGVRIPLASASRVMLLNEAEMAQQTLSSKQINV